MKTITFTKTSMQSGNVVKFIEFTNTKKAVNHFAEVVSELSYGNQTSNENSISKKLEAGGVGYDYRVELEIVNV